MTLKEYVDSLELTEDKAATLRKAWDKYEFYRNVLCRAGVIPTMTKALLRGVDLDSVDDTQEALLIEKAKAEFCDFIKKGARR